MASSRRLVGVVPSSKGLEDTVPGVRLTGVDRALPAEAVDQVAGKLFLVVPVVVGLFVHMLSHLSDLSSLRKTDPEFHRLSHDTPAPAGLSLALPGRGLGKTGIIRVVQVPKGFSGKPHADYVTTVTKPARSAALLFGPLPAQAPGHITGACPGP